MSDARQQWEEIAPTWERGRELLWDSTRVVSEWLIEHLQPKPGQTILDLAAGTGETGFLAAPMLLPDGQLITSDISTNMLAAAERVAPLFGVRNVEFRNLNAEKIDLPDASVDGVLSRFGYILKGDPPPSLSEIRRVLRPGGRLAFAVWAEREHNRWMTVPAEVMVEHGHLEEQTAAQRKLSGRRNPQSIKRLLDEAGFGDAQIDEMPVGYRFANAEELWFFVSELRGPVPSALANLGESERRAVRAEIERRADRAGEGFELSGISLNVVAA